MATKQVNKQVNKQPVAPVNALAALAATLAAAPAPAVAAPAPVVALRGGAAVARVAIKEGAVYRTKAPHNVAWWATLQSACATAPAPVADLCKQPAQGGHGVPAHFVGYCLRRGYLVAA
jgi:hypothetical protein